MRPLPTVSGNAPAPGGTLEERNTQRRRELESLRLDGQLNEMIRSTVMRLSAEGVYLARASDEAALRRRIRQLLRQYYGRP